LAPSSVPCLRHVVRVVPAQHVPRRHRLWRRAKGPKMTLNFLRSKRDFFPREDQNTKNSVPAPAHVVPRSWAVLGRLVHVATRPHSVWAEIPSPAHQSRECLFFFLFSFSFSHFHIHMFMLIFYASKIVQTLSKSHKMIMLET
jgi:hypothetical protein